MSQIMDQVIALVTVKNYKCAGCWGHLTTFHIPGSQDVEVRCLKCGPGRGFVTRWWVSRQRALDVGNAMDVRPMLISAGVIDNPHAGKSADQLIKELGF